MSGHDRKASPTAIEEQAGSRLSPLPSFHDEKKRRTPHKTPLPWFQFSIVLFLQLAEPLTSQVIYPFTPQLIREIGVTGGDETKVGYYVGIMQSLFFVAEAITVLHWSRLSDRIGRKPVILCGLLGLSVSMYLFGLSTTFWGLVFSRCLNGGLNGNIGVMKSIMAELTDSTNIAQAYAYQPLAWSTGATLGPIIGGTLAHPVERFPSLFGTSQFLREYPYFLACAIPATFTVIAWIVTALFLEETSPVKHQGSLLQRLFSTTKPSGSRKESPYIRLSASPAESSIELNDSNGASLPLRGILTRRVIIASANYAILSFVDIAFRAIQPLFLSTPIELGGLGLSPDIIGHILSMFGVLNGIIQVFFFAGIQDRWGSKRVFTAGIFAAFPAFALFPAVSYLAQVQGVTMWVFVLVWLQIVVSVGISLAFGSIFIFISEAAPNRQSLGAVNGVSQMAVSVMRAIGPAIANSLFALSMDGQYLRGWLVYYVMFGFVCFAVFTASLLPRQPSIASRMTSMA